MDVSGIIPIILTALSGGMAGGFLTRVADGHYKTTEGQQNLDKFTIESVLKANADAFASVKWVVEQQKATIEFLEKKIDALEVRISTLETDRDKERSEKEAAHERIAFLETKECTLTGGCIRGPR